MKTKESKSLSPRSGSPKTKKRKSQRPLPTASAMRTPAWRVGARGALEHSEKQLGVIGLRVLSLSKEMEAKTIRELAKFEKKWDTTQHWLEDRLNRLKEAELKAEGIVDTTIVQAHLAKMDTGDKLAGFKNKYESMRANLASLRERTGQETIHALENLSAACLNLKHKLESHQSSNQG